MWRRRRVSSSSGGPQRVELRSRFDHTRLRALERLQEHVLCSRGAKQSLLLLHKTFAQRIPSEKTSPGTSVSRPEAGGTPGGAELLTQLVGGGDNVSGDARVQISVHDAERVQLGHVVPPDLKEGDNSTRAHPGQEEGEEEGEEAKVKQVK